MAVERSVIRIADEEQMPRAREVLAERAVTRAEQASWGSALVDRLSGAFGRVVRPGPLKDALSGTRMGHPLHPLLTDVTIGSWTAAIMLDYIGPKGSERAADRLVALGLLSAAPTAVTGLSEISDEPAKPVRAIGGVHALTNLSGSLLFGVSYLLRRAGRRRLGRAFSLAGSAALTAGGFLGGDLAYRRGVGVDRTVFDDQLADWTPAMPADDLPEREPRRARAGRTDVMLYRDGDRFSAMAVRCTHRGGPLDEGEIADGSVTCPWHGSSFRLADGAIVRGPATAPQPCFDVRVREGMLEVRGRG